MSFFPGSGLFQQSYVQCTFVFCTMAQLFITVPLIPKCAAHCKLLRIHQSLVCFHRGIVTASKMMCMWLLGWLDCDTITVFLEHGTKFLRMEPANHLNQPEYGAIGIINYYFIIFVFDYANYLYLSFFVLFVFIHLSFQMCACVSLK